MKLKRLEVTGFKSFSGKQVFHFEHPVTAIVGPNGSGKSNVREALSFVLGEQSLKSLRGRRSEDLIFNGSKTLPRVNRASVRIVFDNTSRVVPHAFDEVEIERVVSRDSTHQYFVNSSSVRLKDVNELLSKAKIGGGSHHTISQGEADRALSLSPKERRALVEESLGLSYPQGQKREALNKLEKTRDNMREVEIRRREHLPHLRYLEREMKAIEEHKALTAELADKLRLFVPRKRNFFAEETQKLAGEIQKTKEELDALRSRAEEGVAEVAVQDDSHKQELTERLGDIRQQKSAALRALGALEAKKEVVPVAETNLLSWQETSEAVSGAQRDLEQARVLDNMDEVKRLVNQALDTLSSLFSSHEPVEVDESAEDSGSIEDAIAFQKQDIQKLEEEEREVEERLQNAQKDHLEEVARAKAQNEGRDSLLFQIESLESLQKRLEQQAEDLKRTETRFRNDLRTWAFLIGSSSFLDLQDTTDSEEEIDLQELEKSVERLVARVESVAVGDKEETVREFEKARTHHDFLENEIEDLKATSKRLEEVIAELTEKINRTFTAGLSAINDHFSRFFAKMFEGGTAKLVETSNEKTLSDGTMETEKGIEIEVELSHKRIKSLSMLSGGERTLVSIALVSALSAATPPPFLILDEADAALDEANSKRYGDLVEELSKQSQLILITHNRETMSRAGRLYGITMGQRACSELLSIDLGEAEELAR